MLRLWDKGRLKESRSTLAIPFAGYSPVVLVADEVGEAISNGAKAQYPVCSPPFRNLAIEMIPSPFPFEIKHFEGMHGKQNETLVSTTTGALVLLNAFTGHNKAVQLPDDLLNRYSPNDHWYMGGLIHFEVDGRVQPAYGAGCIIDKKTGTLVDWSGVVEAIVHDTPTPRGYEMSDLHNHGSGGPSMLDFDDPNTKPCITTFRAALMAISLINCSNIGTEEVYYRRQERRKVQRAGLNLISYKRLVIRPHKTYKSSNPQETEEQKAIHVVRGHFKTYTEDAPLLGRHVGTYWWQPQVRGTARRIIMKDYEVGGTE